MKHVTKLGLALGFAVAIAGSAQAQIKMGVAGPITGPNAAFGAQLKNGTEQAINDINAAGGILGQKITMSVGDDVSDPKQGVSVANKFVADGVKFVVGHFNSGVTMPASHGPHASARTRQEGPRRAASAALTRSRMLFAIA